jgi:hypothetical protein
MDAQPRTPNPHYRCSHPCAPPASGWRRLCRTRPPPPPRIPSAPHRNLPTIDAPPPTHHPALLTHPRAPGTSFLPGHRIHPASGGRPSSRDRHADAAASSSLPSNPSPGRLPNGRGWNPHPAADHRPCWPRRQMLRSGGHRAPPDDLLAGGDDQGGAVVALAAARR